MTTQNKILTENIYLILGGMFIAALVASSLIFQKFFYWSPFGWFRFEISVGILPYPITFLITDIISEIYGKKKANRVVAARIAASIFSVGIIFIADTVPATNWSPVQDDTFSHVFGLSSIAVLASMMAYLFAQFIDIRIFHYWKVRTKGKHLWLRNNFSTFIFTVHRHFYRRNTFKPVQNFKLGCLWNLIIERVLIQNNHRCFRHTCIICFSVCTQKEVWIESWGRNKPLNPPRGLFRIRINNIKRPRYS